MCSFSGGREKHRARFRLLTLRNCGHYFLTFLLHLISSGEGRLAKRAAQSSEGQTVQREGPEEIKYNLLGLISLGKAAVNAGEWQTPSFACSIK